MSDKPMHMRGAFETEHGRFTSGEECVYIDPNGKEWPGTIGEVLPDGEADFVGNDWSRGGTYKWRSFRKAMTFPNPMALEAKALEAAIQSGPLASAIVDRHGIAVKLLWREALADPTHGDEDILNPAGAPHRTVPLGIYIEPDLPARLRALPAGTEIGPKDLQGQSRKIVFNAFTHAARIGVLERLGYGRYRRTSK